VSFHWRRPSTRMVNACLADARRQALTYEPVGLSLAPSTGYRADDASAILGVGDEVFGRARVAFEQWRQFDLGWADVFPKGALIAEGTVVAVQARTLGMWSLNACRIVSTCDTAYEFSFAYGTLPNHAESGEETFRLLLDPLSAEVRYEIRAVSRARALLTKIGGPVARLFQARFREHSIAAMRRAVARTG